MKNLTTMILATVIGISMASPTFGVIGDTIYVSFDERTGQDTSGNPAGFLDTPMVTLGGSTNYAQPWEVFTAADSGGGVTGLTGEGTVTLDKIPSLPAGTYTVALSANIANWNNGSSAGFYLGGTGVTELGNELPGQYHMIYPQTTNGQEPVNGMQLAGPDMGPGSDRVRDQDGNPITFTSNGYEIPTGSDPNGVYNDGNSFPTAIQLAEGNEVVLHIQDNNPHGAGHIRVYNMTFTEIAAIPEPATLGLMGMGAVVLVLRRRRAA